jgi:hypothetical protein
VEYTASQVRQLKDFFAEFIDRPATANEAKALARETQDAVKALERSLADLTGQKAQYPFVSALDGTMTMLRDMATKPLDWFLTDLPRIANDLLDTKENTIDPVVNFMQGSQRAIYDQARTLVQDQEDNFGYVNSAAVEAVRTVLADSKPWQGNKLTQLRPQLDALQQAIDQQVTQERTQAQQKLTQLQQRLQGVEGYATLTADQKGQLQQPFEQIQTALGRQKRIAMIRDQVRGFEDQTYSQLLGRLDQMLRPAPVPAPTPGPAPEGGDFPPAAPVPPPIVGEPRMVHRNSVRVEFPRPWLATAADVDEYLVKLRTALMQEIEAGNRVQI